MIIWGGKTTGDTVIQLVDSARKRRSEIILIERGVPVGFAVFAVLLAIAGGIIFQKKEKGDEVKYAFI